MAESSNKVTHKVVKPSKDIIASSAEDLRKKLLTHVKNGIQELTIDLSKVQIVDSLGLGVLIAAHNSLCKSGGKLKIKNASDGIYKLLKLMRLDQHFEVGAAK